MDFARRQLEKYGWEEGQGLGKNNDGIADALKPKLKFDTHGLGRDVGMEVIDPWWARVYDEAAKNISAKNTDRGVVIETVVKKKSKKKKKSRKDYCNFVKTAELTVGGEKKLIDDDNYSDSDNRTVDKRKVTSGICDLTDEELLKACGNRTAHKGARHGLSMNAKLKRLEEQEITHLVSTEDGEIIEKPKRKKKKKNH